MGAWRAAALATEFGFTVCGSLLGGVLLGRYLDERLDTAPLLFLLGLLGGFVSSLYLIYVIYRIQIQPRRLAPKARAAAPSPAAADPIGLPQGTPHAVPSRPSRDAEELP
jgi:F0F1-type ATP synthase assembly protein I